MAELKDKIVVDASVAVKCYIKEKDRDRALKLRDMHVRGETCLLAPELIIYEVCNALRYNPEFTEEDVISAAESLFQLHLNLKSPEAESVSHTLQNAFKYDITVYDASYLSIAEKENCRFVTTDERLYAKVKKNPAAYLLSSERSLEIVG